MKLLNNSKIFVASLLVTAALAACSAGSTPSTTTADTSASSQSEATATTAPAAEAATEAPAEEAVPAEAATEAPAEESSSEPAAAVAMTKLNLNTVTGEELLATIPGFGNRMVREFEEYRPYASIQQFRREIGKYVDDNQVAEYEKYVYVPINVNEADADTLMQLPGVDDAKAAELIAGRPYASNDAFVEKLATVVTADEAAAGAGYLEAQ